MSAPSSIPALPEGRIVVCAETPSDLDWLRKIPWPKANLSPLYLCFVPPGSGPVASDGNVRLVGAASGGASIPSLDPVFASLTEGQPEACLVIGSGPLARFASVSADLLGLPVFQLVITAEEMQNASRRTKARPDLFFLATPTLLPRAIEDERYGSTLLPTGHPAGSIPSDADAAERIIAAIAAWRETKINVEPPVLTIIVPSYNEEGNVAMVCDRLRAMIDESGLHAEVLMVDDHSRDGTYQAALDAMWRWPSMRALTKPPPRGMGVAIRHGLRYARASIVAVTMGDGSDEVERLPEMFRQVRDHGFGLAIGSRYRYRVNFAAVPRLYRFWSFCFKLVTRLLIGLRLSDYTNAFRVFDRRIFSRYGPESGGYEISPEITFKAWFATKRVTEVDVRHLKRSTGQSNFSFFRAGPGYLRMVIKAFVNRITGRWFTLDW